MNHDDVNQHLDHVAQPNGASGILLARDGSLQVSPSLLLVSVHPGEDEDVDDEDEEDAKRVIIIVEVENAKTIPRFTHSTACWHSTLANPPMDSSLTLSDFPQHALADWHESYIFKNSIQ